MKTLQHYREKSSDLTMPFEQAQPDGGEKEFSFDEDEGEEGRTRQVGAGWSGAKGNHNDIFLRSKV